jgi:HlyD family secretion protein
MGLVIRKIYLSREKHMKIKRKRRFLWWIIPLALVGAAAGALFWFRAHPVQTQAATLDLTKLTTTKVVMGSVSTGISASGTVRTNQNATLSWSASGKVAQVTVKKGDQVKANQILAQIDPASSTALVSAQANLASAQQTLADLQDVTVSQANAKIALINAQTAVDDAQTTQDNLQVVPTQAQIDAAYTTLLTDQQTVDKLQAAYDKVSGLDVNDLRRAQALSALEGAKQTRDQAASTWDYLKNYKPDATSVAQAEANLALVKAQLVVAQANYDAVKNGPDATKVAAAQANISQIQAALDQQYIRAPFDGTMTTVNVNAGDQVSSGSSAFRIDDTSALYIDLQVSEVDINSVNLDQSVDLTFDAITDQAYTAKITDVGSVGTVSGGVANFTVTAHLTNANSAVRPGMTATANIVIQQVSNVLLVPNHSITTFGKDKVVYVLANNQVTPVVVTAGLASDTQTEITSTTLKSGDVVVTNPTSLTTATTTSTGVSSIFGNLFRMLGVTTGGAAGGGVTGGPPANFGGGGPPANFGGGNPPSGSPPSGAPSGNPPSGTGG